MANGTRLEARITFLTAQVMSVAITAIAGSPFTVTVAAGSYFPSDLLTELAAQLNAATALDGAFTVTASLGSSGTGIVTIGALIGMAAHLDGKHVVFGQVVRIASGKPFNPSQQTINASWMPRFRSSVSIVIHCFAPSPPVGPSHIPSTSRSPSMFTPIAT